MATAVYANAHIARLQEKVEQLTKSQVRPENGCVGEVVVGTDTVDQSVH